MTRSAGNVTILDDYVFSMEKWDNFLYKKYDQAMNFSDAVVQCESDSAYLAFPRSSAENEFISNLFAGSQTWIGVHDIGEGGLPITRGIFARLFFKMRTFWRQIFEHGEDGSFVSIDDADLSFTSWGKKEPHDWTHASGVMMNGETWFTRMKNPDVIFPFVCFNRIQCKFNNIKY